MEEIEIWKDIPEYEGLYQVSNFGRVKSLERIVLFKDNRVYVYKEQMLKQWISRGYPTINLHKNNIRKTFRVHCLVASAFLENPDNLPCINHKDENKQNNYVDNLEWCTHEYNMNYGTRNERISNKHKGKKRSKEFIKKKQIKILQYTLDDNFIREWESIKQASEELNINSGYICNCLKGRRKQCSGFIWKYK